MSEGPPESSDRPSEAKLASREAISITAAVTLASALAITYAFNPERAGKPSVLAAMGVPYAVLAAAALHRLHRRGELRRELWPRSGDLTFGAMTAALLYGAATAAHLTITRSSPREGWIMRLYAQIGVGDPLNENGVLLGLAVFVIAALEEIVWRGFVMRSIESAKGQKWAWASSTLLYAAVHVPTCVLLGDPAVGPNPLIVSAALGCGFVWGYLALRTNRLSPAIFAHALFSWLIVEFPVWRP